MYEGKKFIAIIPARGGSKGIPKKNLAPVKGKPLIQYTIDEALKSSYLDKVIVSTDSEEIAQVSKLCGAEVPFMRPKELASDQAKTIDVLVHVIEEMKNQFGQVYDYLVLLQPTQPLREAWQIDEAIEKIIGLGGNGLASVSEVKDHPVLIRTIEETGSLKNLLKMNSTVRRQDFPSYFKINGAIYINKLDETFNENTSLNDNKMPYVMSKEYDLDIDEPSDLELFRFLVSQK